MMMIRYFCFGCRWCWSSLGVSYAECLMCGSKKIVESGEKEMEVGKPSQEILGQ